ncbi:MAG: hypothetical protein FVQ83_07885 [Chloroflexi bacterium]|nr:hypothetical protein [Chloroflexota bacterium]
MKFKSETMKKVIMGIAATRPDEIGCDTCYEYLHRFADMLKNGEDPAKVLPLVQHHLEMCGSCGEEFEALLLALEALEADIS